MTIPTTTTAPVVTFDYNDTTGAMMAAIADEAIASKGFGKFISTMVNAGREFQVREAFMSVLSASSRSAKHQEDAKESGVATVLATSLVDLVAAFLITEVAFLPAVRSIAKFAAKADKKAVSPVISAIRSLDCYGVSRLEKDDHDLIAATLKHLRKTPSHSVVDCLRPLAGRSGIKLLTDARTTINKLRVSIRTVLHSFLSATDSHFQVLDRVSKNHKEIWVIESRELTIGVYDSPQSIKHNGLNVEAGGFMDASFKRIQNMVYAIDTDLAAAFISIYKSEEFYTTLQKSYYSDQRVRRQRDRLVNDASRAISEFVSNGGEGYNSAFVADRRGRITMFGPVSSVSSKKIRPILRNGNAVALGTSGYDSICIGNAGAYGHDKCSWEDRIAFTMAGVNTFIEIGALVITDPIAAYSRVIELDADNAFRALSYALELYRISLHVEAGNTVDTFKTDILIPIDQTSSGSQHCAAVLKDIVAGKTCNLCSVEVQTHANDIYLLVVNAIRSFITDESNIHLNYFNNLSDSAARKCVKSACMTILYGSSFSTWLKSFITAAEGLGYDAPKEFATALTPLFKVAFDTQPEISSLIKYLSFMKEAAKAYSTSPVQPSWNIMGQSFTKEYYTPARENVTINTHGKSRTVPVYLTDFALELNAIAPKHFHRTITTDAKALKRGLAPNFIHSLDATFLHLLVGSNPELGTMALCHDSLAVAPSLLPSLLKAVKETWVSIYSSHTILEDFQARCFADTGVLIDLPEDYSSRDCIPVQMFLNALYSMC